ncbi:hypothetical protein GUITHDRAFT_119401 [Guillardia theta CCMP2712]|uniref:Uncharacterized protein n=1 Tax=Guillardia theta (strain CCMP2712) TaxID=905079 RepID=L1IER8_GUITC|nr:hypothetical protein GUITHDRAFT_119401 [Guillardia theta CCMP2712]EKX34399.1 hypothetical protein GUITHDRAFT_119401 [Guillardia theta CCMP2712]|eukprot:XP_005821379.1 hypothetical protein GUITHDRAFT_119401 [Guillardia theta CCMP2712]
MDAFPRITSTELAVTHKLFEADLQNLVKKIQRYDVDIMVVFDPARGREGPEASPDRMLKAPPLDQHKG